MIISRDGLVPVISNQLAPFPGLGCKAKAGYPRPVTLIQRYNCIQFREREGLKLILRFRWRLTASWEAKTSEVHGSTKSSQVEGSPELDLHSRRRRRRLRSSLLQFSSYVSLYKVRSVLSGTANFVFCSSKSKFALLRVVVALGLENECARYLEGKAR